VIKDLLPLVPAVGERRNAVLVPGEFLTGDHSGRIGKVEVTTQSYWTLQAAVLATPVRLHGLLMIRIAQMASWRFMVPRTPSSYSSETNFMTRRCCRIPWLSPGLGLLSL
jgi:hypothetical protein